MPPDIRIVLVGTQHPGNLGSAARAMKTMGLSALHLVAPERFPHAEASAMAVGADDVLGAAAVHRNLDIALADCRLVLGCTARSRHVPLPELTPREAAQRLLAAADGAPVALLFGRERTGLTNDELQRCHAAVHIPAVPGFSSLNLAASVQVLAYELRLATLAAESVGAASAAPGSCTASSVAAEAAPTEAAASQAELEAFFGHLGETLHDIDFHKGRSPVTVMRRLRRLFLRAQPDARELRILRGVFADAQRMARMARREDEA